MVVNGTEVSVADDGASLLEVLRDRLGVRSPKDGCSPQGQCGCCTVLVDGQPRVSCVTPARRVRGRSITTLEGLEDRVEWAEAFTETGASQCGFCTPGIICRLAGLESKTGGLAPAQVSDALKAHLCRCTGWQTIVEAAERKAGHRRADTSRDMAAAAQRAHLEGGTPQHVGPDVALGLAPFADDTAPTDALVAVPVGAEVTDPDVVEVEGRRWLLAETLVEARARAGKVQGRRTTVDPVAPLALPAGDWAATLQTRWVDPAYLEADASWCRPGGEPASPLANGGAFGGKVASPVGSVARSLADATGRVVRVLLPREAVVQDGPKRPPVAGGADATGVGVMRVVATPGIEAVIAAVAPGLRVEKVAVPGPPTSSALRGAGWVEALVLLRAATAEAGDVVSPDGGRATAVIDDTGIHVTVAAGDVLDHVVLRSYCIGAAHMAYSWMTSEALAVDADGQVHDLTIRSLGVLRAIDTPPITVEIDTMDHRPPCNGSDAVFAAVAAAAHGHMHDRG